MLTITHPELLGGLLKFPGGLFPIRIPGESALRLIIKCPKEWILAAKLNRGFRIYVAPLTAQGLNSCGMVSAFFDDADEPLTLWTALFDDEFTAELRELFSSDELIVHMFDEHNRELLGYSATNKDAARFGVGMGEMAFAPFSVELARDIHDKLPEWFGLRTSQDDDEAYTISFGEPLFPDDMYIQDVRPSANAYHGAKSPMHTMLEREDAGHFNELDIVHALQRIFQNDDIYLNPMRDDDGKEFVDVLVITPNTVFLVQAKDSPNTEKVLQRSLGRKMSTVVGHLKKAVDQMRGSISYARSCVPLKISTGDKDHQIDLGDRDLVGLIIVKELFNSEYSVYSPPVLGLFNETAVPCFVLDYPELHSYTVHLADEAAFISALNQVFSVGIERGEFPRLRFGLPPSA
uniref:NERD domain-containing protein n=1 Tax=Bosea sp. NBC_00436 TaxID=2969620 RepID=A0A9E7ZWC5_9HYPH